MINIISSIPWIKKVRIWIFLQNSLALKFVCNVESELLAITADFLKNEMRFFQVKMRYTFQMLAEFLWTNKGIKTLCTHTHTYTHTYTHTHSYIIDKYISILLTIITSYNRIKTIRYIKNEYFIYVI